MHCSLSDGAIVSRCLFVCSFVSFCFCVCVCGGGGGGGSMHETFNLRGSREKAEIKGSRFCICYHNYRIRLIDAPDRKSIGHTRNQSAIPKQSVIPNQSVIPTVVRL